MSATHCLEFAQHMRAAYTLQACASLHDYARVHSRFQMARSGTSLTDCSYYPTAPHSLCCYSGANMQRLRLQARHRLLQGAEQPRHWCDHLAASYQLPQADDPYRCKCQPRPALSVVGRSMSRLAVCRHFFAVQILQHLPLLVCSRRLKHVLLLSCCRFRQCTRGPRQVVPPASASSPFSTLQSDCSAARPTAWITVIPCAKTWVIASGKLLSFPHQ